jgi:hypothetical protein
MTPSILLRSSVLSIMVAACLLWALPTLEASAQTNWIKLFDAAPVTNSGPIRSQSVTFGQTDLVLACPPVPAATVSSNPEGTGPVVVDNFLTVNGRNVCPGNCFQKFNGGSSDASLAYTGVPALEISASIPSGINEVRFAIQDYGGFAGNSEVWLLTNCFLWTEESWLMPSKVLGR